VRSGGKTGAAKGPEKKEEKTVTPVKRGNVPERKIGIGPLALKGKRISLSATEKEKKKTRKGSRHRTLLYEKS